MTSPAPASADRTGAGPMAGDGRFTCFPEDVLAFVSDRLVDFTLVEEVAGFSRIQAAYLQGRTGRAVPWPVPLRQVHGARVRVVTDPGERRTVAAADAALTAVPGLALAVRTADCLPVFLWDPVRRMIGVAHAGWRGTASGVTAALVRAFVEAGCAATGSLTAAFGPAVRSCCYEVGPEVAAVFPGDVRFGRKGCRLDLAAANRRQLEAAGVAPDRIHDCGVCTCCDHRFFSFRREGAAAGRQIALMMILEELGPSDDGR